MTFFEKCAYDYIDFEIKGEIMAQKLLCPMCYKVLIKNTDLVIDKPIIMDLEKIKTTTKEIKTITCHNCKRKIRYYIAD